MRGEPRGAGAGKGGHPSNTKSAVSGRLSRSAAGLAIVGARYLALGMMLEYRYKVKGRDVTSRDYEWATHELDAIYASGRLVLPFTGLLLFGY